MDVIKCSKRSLNLIQPRAPLPPMTIPLITAEIKDAQEVDYHTDDEPSETSRPVTHDTDGASIENNESSQEKNEAILESKHKIQEKETDIKPPTVTFSKSIPKDASKMADKSRDRPPVESSFGTPRVPLPLGEVRRTQRRVAALLQQKPTGIVQPKPPRKPHRVKAFHFCMCSRMDPDGLFRDPALNFLREGLKNVGKDFPEFCYTQRRSRHRGQGPTTARSMDDTLLPRSPLTTPMRDPYTGRPSSKGFISPGDITDFDYRKLKSMIMARERFPKISENQKVTNPNAALTSNSRLPNLNSRASRDHKLHSRGSNVNSNVPDNTPVGTAEARTRTVKLPKVVSTYENTEESYTPRSEKDPSKNTTNTHELGNNIPSKKNRKSKPISHQVSGSKSQVTGLKTEATFKPKPFDGTMKTKSSAGNNHNMPFAGVIQTKPFEGAVQTKPLEGAMQTRPVITKNQTQVSTRQESTLHRSSSGYESDGGTENMPPHPSSQKVPSRLLRHEDSTFLRSMPSVAHELSVVGSGQGSRDPTMYQDYTYIRTEATRSTSPFSDDSYSFVRGREDTYDSFMMPSFAPSSVSHDRFQPVTPNDAEFEDDPRAILQHQYREPTTSSIDVYEKMEELNLKFDSGTFDFSTDLNVDDVDTTLRVPKEPTAAPSELPTIPETPKVPHKRRRWESDRPVFPGGVREAYMKALAVAAARHRMPQESWMFGQNISRAFVFSYFDHVPHVCPDCEKPVLRDDRDEIPTPSRSPRKTPFRVKNEMKHIFKDVEVDDYYPGGKRNPMPRVDWHRHRKSKRK